MTYGGFVIYGHDTMESTGLWSGLDRGPLLVAWNTGIYIFFTSMKEPTILTFNSMTKSVRLVAVSVSSGIIFSQALLSTFLWPR